MRRWRGAKLICRKSPQEEFNKTSSGILNTTMWDFIDNNAQGKKKTQKTQPKKKRKNTKKKKGKRKRNPNTYIMKDRV